MDGSLLAVLGWIVFGALAFGMRSLLQLIRTGSTGFRGIGGGLRERAAGVGFALGVLLAALASLLSYRGVLPPIDGLASDAVRAIGLGSYAVGLGLVLWSQLAMGDSWRIGVDPSERTQLVTRGPFGVVRNPIFTSTWLCTAGLLLLAPSALAIAALILLVVSTEAQVRLVEEPYLLGVHGEAYRAYAARVGRFFPGLGHRLSDPSRGGR